MNNLLEKYCSLEFSEENPNLKEDIICLKNAIRSGNRNQIKKKTFAISKKIGTITDCMTLEINENIEQNLNSLNFVPRKLFLGINPLSVICIK